jgi:hypothetical protein
MPITPTITGPVRLWPRRTYAMLDIVKDIRRLLGDPFGVIISDSEIIAAVGEAAEAAHPTFTVINQYTYQWPAISGDLEVPVQVDLPASTSCLVINVHWVFEGGRYRITNYDVSDKLHLYSLLPNPVGKLLVDVIDQPPGPTSTADTVTVPRRYITHATALQLLEVWKQRAKVDRPEDRLVWTQTMQGEVMRSGGGPSVDEEGRYLG